MDIKITKQDGRVYFLENLGFDVWDFIVSSISIRSEYAEMEGAAGVLDLGATLGSRSVTVPFSFSGKRLLDYPVLRDRLFEIVTDTEPYYIEELRRAERQSYAFADPTGPPPVPESGKNELFSGKRYFVRLADQFDLEQTLAFGEGELRFETAELPFAESVNVAKRRFTTSGFLFKNEGSVIIDPRQQEETEIRFRGAANNLIIRNTRTGDEWRHNGTLAATDEVLLKGVRQLKNGRSFLNETNKRLIRFAPGNNPIEIIGATGAFEAGIDTRFYFL